MLRRIKGFWWLYAWWLEKQAKKKILDFEGDEGSTNFFFFSVQI
jgi:hypothetical protein